MKSDKIYRLPLCGSVQKVSLTFTRNGNKAGTMYRICLFILRRICQLNLMVFDGKLVVSAYLHENMDKIEPEQGPDPVKFSFRFVI